MQTHRLLVAACLLAATLAVLPSAQAAPPGPQCVLPCDGPVPDVPECKPMERWDNGGTLHTTVDRDCHVRIDHKPYDCVWNCAWRTVVDTPYLTIRTYGQTNGETASAAASESPPGIQPPPQCVTSPCCFAPCPPPCYDTGCPPPVACRELAVRTSDLLAYIGPHAGVALHRDCTVDAWESGLPCPKAAPERGHVERIVGPVEADADTCVPNLDCTCDPILAPASAAAWQLPDLAALPQAAAPVPPIYCVMAPCGPQCLVPCVPPLVPDGCDLRQATPASTPVRDLEPRERVWGDDCTADVEPVYDCVGAWGFDRHVTAAFVDVTVRVCTGGPFPPPLVQAILDALRLES